VTPPRADDASAVSAAAAHALFERAGAARWGLTFERFLVRLDEAGHRRGAADDTTPDGVFATTHADDLGLAIACAEGLDAAWEHFILTFRPELYRAARVMTDDATGRELADSLYADLFGQPGPNGERRSLFRYYHGRAKLTTWLRSVLAQRHVDLVRARKRTIPLDADDAAPDTHLPAAAPVDPAVAEAMSAAALAVTAALAALGVDDRRRLAGYYVHGLKLAAIGRMFDESEATASRKLERVRQTLRRAIEAALAEGGMQASEVDDWAVVARSAWDTTLAEVLGVAPPHTTGPHADGPEVGSAQDTALPPFKGMRTP